MAKTKIAREVAQAEVDKWIEYKGFSERKIETNSDSVEKMVDAFEDGVLVLNPDDFEITQILRHQVGGEIPIKQLVFRSRMKVSDIQMQFKGVKTSDTFGMIAAYIAALTKQPKAVITDLDTEDYAIASTIAVFFM